MLTLRRSTGEDVYELSGDRVARRRVSHELETAGWPEFAGALRAEVDVVVFSAAVPEIRADLEAASLAAGVVIVAEEG